MKSFYILISVLFFSVFGASAQYTLIPDAGFEANLIELGYDSGPIDGMVTTANISGVTSLFIDVLVIGDQNVNDFTGIEDFASLTNFRANFVSAPSIDLSNNMALVSVNVIGSQLTHVNIQNTTNTNLVTLNIISVANNSTLSPVKICVDDAAYAQANFGDIYAAGTYFVEDCSVSVNSIMGTTYFDADNNGCDVSEIVTTNGTIVTAGANYSFSTPLYFENYATYSLDQNVTTELQGLPPYFTVTPGTTIFNYGANTGNLDVVDYCITANAVVNDLQIEGYTVLPTKPGFTSPFRIFYENLGTTTLSGSVSLQYEDLKQDYYSDNADVTPTISGNTITWAFTNLAPFEEKYIDVNFTINTPTDPANPVNGGDTLTYVTDITPISGDVTPANNTHVFNAGVVNAYDPNDVTCFEGDKISLAQVPDDLTYRIRFQNTGSAAATNILVENAIDSDLDISTFQFIGASDPVTISTTGPNEMRFTFLNINLPDSTSDEPNSHGWILYKMKPQSTAIIGDVFENTASIYFDYNAPIITNTATTTVAATTYVPDDNFENYLETHNANGVVVAIGDPTSMGNGIANDDLVFTCNIDMVTLLDVFGQSIADITGLEDFAGLQVLSCGFNQLTSINLSSNTNLVSVQLHHNLLTSLDVSVNTSLVYLECQNNQLTSLNVKNGNNINFTGFLAQTNPNLLCIEVDDAAYSSSTWTNIDPISSFSENCATFGLTYVPDDNFENFLEANGMGNGIPLDDYVTTANINTVTALNVTSQNIADLTGIEGFTLLENLIATSNNLTTVDISQNAQLLTINFLFNSLTALDVSQNLLLTSIITHHNNLTSLDISNNLNLLGLDCRVNNILALDISNPLLAWVHTSDNGMTSLTTGANTALATLYCHNNALTNLDFSANTNLSLLYANNNQLTSLNVKNGNNVNVTEFRSQTNPNLLCIEVDDAAYSAATWTSIDPASGFSENCATFGLTYVPDDNFETYLETHNASGVFVGFNGPGNMGNGIALDDFVTTTNINTVTDLDVFSLSIADLTGVEDFTSLEHLFCYSNQLTALDVTQNLNLDELHCGSNLLTTLDLTQNPGLTYLVFGNNQISVIDVTNNQNLTHLGCYNNQLASINLLQNSSLQTFEAFSNMFTSFDFSNNLSLLWIRANSNQLTTLDVSLNTSLREVRVNNNLLTSLNVKNTNNTNFTTFDSTFNPNLLCIEVDDAAYSTSTWTNIDPVSSFSENCATFGLTYVPDDNFETYLETHDASGAVVAIGDPTSMGNGIALDDYVPTANITTVISLDVASQGISDLTGIEDFAALQNLIATSNNLTTVDISQNTQLLTVNFLFNSLTALDVSQNLMLVTLITHHNNLTSLDISNNLQLTGLDCRVNNISALDISNPLLAWVHTSDNGMTSLTTGANTALATLYCHNNALTNLDFSVNTNLSLLYANNNQLTSLNVKNGNNINFTEFQSQTNSNLLCIEVDDAAYSSTNWLNVDPVSSFSENCAAFGLTYVPDNNFEAYLETHDANGGLVSIGSSSSMGNGIINDDYVFTNRIDTVTDLDINTKSIADLTGIEDFTALQNLIAHTNLLTAVDITQNVQLLTINFLFNSLTTLDVSANTLLTNIITHQNNLTSLDVSNNLLLTGLDCRGNNISVLDISNPLLTWVHCSDNGMTSLTTGANASLATLYCHNNAITDLDFSANTNLSLLQVQNNQLTGLNVQNGNNLNFTQFQAQINPSLSCIFVDDAAWSAVNWTSIDGTSNFVNNQAECDVLGTNDFEIVHIKLFPNPAKSTIQISGLNSIENYTLYNTIGVEVSKGVVQNNTTINVQLLPSGIYFLKLESGNILKFVKE